MSANAQAHPAETRQLQMGYLPAAQQALRTWFTVGTGGAFGPRDVVICPSSQAAMATTFRALAHPDHPVLMKSSTYYGNIAAARAAGLRPAVLLPATFSNPAGTVLPPERRAAVLAAAERHGAFAVEDDWARNFALDGGAPPPLAATDRVGHVVYLRSLTKSAAPSLQIGALCARGPAADRLRAARQVDDFFVPGLMQETALQLVTPAA